MKILKPLFLFLSLIPEIIGVKNYQDIECPNVESGLRIDNRENMNKLRLMQYNVEWLFIDYYSGSDCPGNGCTWKNESEANIHLEYVYKVIDEINPDIINFCEIEGCDELNILNNKLGNIYNSYLLKGTDTATGQNVGMLTKIDPLTSLIRSDEKASYPIEGSECGYTGSGSTGVSKHYISEFNINDINIAIIGAHLIAIPTESSRCAQREGQATILQGIIKSYIEKGYEVIMMGDFNDFDDEVLDMNNNMPNSKVLEILKGKYGENANTYKLTSVAEYLPQFLRFSDWYDSDNNCNTESRNDYSMIDHILVSDGLLEKINFIDIYHGYKEYCEKMNSDHYPVIVEFNF